MKIQKRIMLLAMLLIVVGQAVVSAQYIRVDQTIEEKSLSGDVLRFTNQYVIKQDSEQILYRVETKILTPVPGWPAQVTTYFDFQRKRICLQADNPQMLVYHDMRDTVRFKIPTMGMDANNSNVVITNRVEETYDQWRCTKITYLIVLANGVRYTSRVWYARELNDMPVYIENDFPYGQETIRFYNWRFDQQDVDGSKLAMPIEKLSQLIGQ